MIPLLSFFVVYYDYRKYNNSGEIVKNYIEISKSYTYGKNNDKYNPNWIAEAFGRQVSDELEQTLGKLLEYNPAQIKRIVKIVGLIFLVIFLLSIILLAVLISISG